MITTQEEYANCKAQIVRQEAEVEALLATIASVQVKVDAVSAQFEATNVPDI